MSPRYTSSLENITPDKLVGFFVGWPKPPSVETHLKILKNSAYIMLVLDNETENVVGFINAISDKTLSAYIPLLEVLPEYQKKGIASELIKRLLGQLENYYMVDLICDDELEIFYNKFKMIKRTGMTIRNFDYQSGID